MATNYEKHFGTPELLVKRLMVGFHMCPLHLLRQSVYGFSRCDSCKHHEGCFHATDKQREKFAREWLQEECE